MNIRDKNIVKYTNSVCYLKMFGCYDHINKNSFLLSKLQKLKVGLTLK